MKDPHLRKIAVGLAVIAVVGLSGCSTSTTPSSSSFATSKPTSSKTHVTPTPTPTKAAPVVSAAAKSAALQSQIPQVTKVVQITEDNDPNNDIGRPNAYTEAATLYDSRTPCTDIGADCGATVEIWGTPDLATARATYIQGILKASPVLRSEYDLVQGNAILRITGVMKPSDEAGYATAWASYFAS